MRRYFHKAIAYLLPAEKRFELRERSRYLVINPDATDSDEEEFGVKLERKYRTDRHPDFYSAGFFSSEESESEQVDPSIIFASQRPGELLKI